MDPQIFASLAQDGLTNGAVYALLALALVTVFAVTRIVFVTQGDFLSWGALTMGALESGHLPATAWILLGLGVITFVVDVPRHAGDRGALLRRFLTNVVYPLCLVPVLKFVAPMQGLPWIVHMGLVLAVVAPMGPMIYRLVFEPIADASVLVLLIVAMALHLVMSGIGLVAFGPDGVRTSPISDRQLSWGSVVLSAHGLAVIAVAVALIIGLALFFSRTTAGKVLRASAVNRNGARLLGFSPALAGRRAFVMAAGIGALSGLLVAPMTPIAYDSGFMIGLKGFVAAIMGALASYPLAALGAVVVGMLESFASFWASAYKDVLVFALIIPVLVWISMVTRHVDDDEAPHQLVATPRAGWIDPRWLLGALCAALLLAPWVLPRFTLTLLDEVGIGTLVATGLVLLTGIGGLTSFGQAAFVGIGAYATAWLCTAAPLPPALAPWAPWLGLAAGLVLTALVALLLGSLTLRLSGHYLPLGTLAWGISLNLLFGTSAALGGYAGMSNLPAIHLAGVDFGDGRLFYFLIVVFVALAIVTSRNLLDSRVGRAIRALRGGAVMAEAMGIDVSRSRMIVFVIAALHAATAGWLYAHMQRFVNPTPFSLGAGIGYLFMAVIGGAGQVWGALLGAGVLTLLRQGLQDLLPHLPGLGSQADVIVYGALVIALLHWAPDGLWSLLARLVPVRRRARHIADTAAELPRAPLPPRGDIVLEARAVTRRFGGLVANNNMDLSVRAGEILALIGPNGAGKSTMFNQLSGVDTPTSGSIVFRGARIETASAHRVAALGMSRTFQHVRLLPEMSVLENAAIGAHNRGRRGVLASAWRLDRAEEARLLAEAARQLRRVGLGAYLDAPAGTLALGQQRILEIARALCADPCLLLLDEPAAGLRLKEKEALGDLLRQLRDEGLGILLVEHDMDFVMGLADRVIVMEFGSRIAEGSPETVQRDPAVLAAYLGAD